MKKWNLNYKGYLKETDLDKKNGISPEISCILKNRSINSENELKSFINPSIKYLRDPFLLKDMEKSVDRIKKAINNNERIFIYGDYDVDGVSSTAILCLYFKSIGHPVEYYIPNRLEEGYGLNEDAIKIMYGKGCDLLISVDCGITSNREVDIANELGIDVIITDHHECQGELPNSYSIINPKQVDCNYPFDMLCGCGIAFKLIQALTPKEIFKKEVDRYLEIVSLATICDVVPLIDENRIIVKNGLELMRKGLNIGMKELLKICEIDGEKLGSSHLGFSLGPRINAAGRLGFSYLGVELFTADSIIKAKEIATILEEKNLERQSIELDIYSEAEEMIASNSRYKNDKVLVLASEGWQHGIIGIVASKLTEKYYKPTILLNIENGVAIGSARSIKSFNIFEILCKCSEYLKKFGGHEQAAGLTINEDSIGKFRDKLNEIADYALSDDDMVEKVDVEFELNEKSANLKFIDDLHQLEPFGIKNPTPKFIMRDCEIKEIRIIGKSKQHLKLKVCKKIDDGFKVNKEFECVGFNMSHYKNLFNMEDRVDILFQISENNFRGTRTVQFVLKDIKMFLPKDIYKNNDIVTLMSKLVPKDTKNLYNEIKTNIDLDISDKIKKEDEFSIFDFLRKNTLVITNTVVGFRRAISDLSLLDIDFDINYNKINEKSLENNNIHLIFAPYIDKIQLKRYNIIVLYDYLFNIDEYGYILKNKNEFSELIKYYNEKDLSNLKKEIEEFIPNRDEFVFIYKNLLRYNNLDLNITDILSLYKMSPIKFFVISSVFKELYLVEYKFKGNHILLKRLPISDRKLDLNNSLILKNLKSLYIRYYESYQEDVSWI